MKETYKIGISYDGSQIHGWEGVGNFNYLKNLLIQAIGSFNEQNIQITCAARTDCGVHAQLNFCSFNLQTSMPEYKIECALNSYLPNYLRVLSVEKKPNFNARFSALHRHYKYFLSSEKKNPLLRQYVWFNKFHSLHTISEFSVLIKGEHNFASFCPAKTYGNKIRTIKEFYMEEIFMFGVKIYVINIVAKSFLHHQVRNIVGSLIDLEKNYLSLDQISISLKTGNRIPINVAPALGLYLYDVIY